MSVHVLTAFMDQTQSKLGARLVGMVMADAAGDDGICWLEQEKIMARTGLSERGVRENVRALEELGEVETRQAQRGRRRVNVYRLWCAAPPQYERLPFELDDPFSDDRQKVPVVDDRQISSGRPADSDRDDRQISAPTPLVEQKGNVRERNGRAWQVDRRPVTELEERRATEVLATWNELAGQQLTARDWLASIVMRDREHPELTVEQHRELIKRNLDAPWWKGAASPSVIYGSAAQFERAMLTQPVEGDGGELERARASMGRLIGGRR